MRRDGSEAEQQLQTDIKNATQKIGGPRYLKSEQVSPSVSKSPTKATGEGISSLLPPTQACSNRGHYCCKLFVFVRFGTISSLQKNFFFSFFFSEDETTIHLISCQLSATEFTEARNSCVHELAHLKYFYQLSLVHHRDVHLH